MTLIAIEWMSLLFAVIIIAVVMIVIIVWVFWDRS